MPLYEYRCKRCGHRFDKLVRWSADPHEIICPACAAADAERLISLPARAAAGAGASAAACAPSGGG